MSARSNRDHLRPDLPGLPPSLNKPARYDRLAAGTSGSRPLGDAPAPYSAAKRAAICSVRLIESRITFATSSNSRALPAQLLAS